MVEYNNAASFEHLRRFADRLDFRFGVNNRKRILEGNERLTLTTDAQGWTQWLEGVQKRFASASGPKPDTELVSQLFRLRALSKTQAPENDLAI
jgi:hypothetical protein